VFATFAPKTVTYVEVAVRLYIVEALYLYMRRLVLLRRLLGVCPRERTARRDYLLDIVHLFTLVLFSVNVHTGSADSRSSASSGNVCLATLKEEGTSWVVTGLSKYGTGTRGVG
jgi:hypothetical protein